MCKKPHRLCYSIHYTAYVVHDKCMDRFTRVRKKTVCIPVSMRQLAVKGGTPGQCVPPPPIFSPHLNLKTQQLTESHY